MQHIIRLKGLIGKFRVGMLGSATGVTVKFRPMSHVDIDEKGNVWFFISMNSQQAKDIDRNANVHLLYAKESENSYLSIQGIAYFNHDKGRIRELYNPFLKAWFPKGTNDPTLALLVVQPLEVEYWENTSESLLTASHILA